MNVRQNLQMDKPEFLAWTRAREGRYELAGGRVVMMTGSTPASRQAENHAFRRHQRLCGDRRPESRGQRRDHAGAAPAGQGRARHRQDRAGARDRQSARRAAASSGTSSRPPRRCRAFTSTTRCRGCATASSATPACRTSATTSSAASCGTPSSPTSGPVLLIDEIDKADIEFPNDLLQELDRMEFYVYETERDGSCAPPADRDHHLQQREGAAGRVPAPLLLPLHPLPRSDTMRAIMDVHFPGIKQRLVPRRCASSMRCARCRD